MNINKEMILSIKTTSACNRHCLDCLVAKWMQQEPDYHMTLENIKDLIYFTQRSGYRWKRIIISGGEPLLWKNIMQGTDRLSQSGIAEEIYLYTNALAVLEFNYDLKYLVHNVDLVRISQYDGAEKAIEFMQNHFPEKVRVVDKRKFYPLPTVDGMKPYKLLPADCTCRGYSMVGNEIDLCSPPRFIAINNGWEPQIGEFTVHKTPLQMNYLDAFKDVDCFNQLFCRFCLSNRKVKNKLPLMENIPNGYNRSKAEVSQGDIY